MTAGKASMPGAANEEATRLVTSPLSGILNVAQEWLRGSDMEFRPARRRGYRDPHCNCGSYYGTALHYGMGGNLDQASARHARLSNRKSSDSIRVERGRISGQRRRTL